MYRLTKWYFDLLTPERDFVFVYFASVELAGRSLNSVAVHVARPASRVVRAQALSPPRCDRTDDGLGEVRLQWPGGSIESNAGEWRLCFSGQDCSVRLDYQGAASTDSKPLVIESGGRGSILWVPLGLDYKVSGGVTVDGETLEIQGARGYVDYLESDCLPWRVPVRSLRWGRLNHEAVDLVYSYALSGKDSEGWAALSGRAGGVSFQSEEISLQPAANESSGYPDSIGTHELAAQIKRGQVRLRVEHEAAVQRGGFINQHTSLPRVTRELLRLLARNPRGTKFLARADVDIQVAGLHLRERGLPMIDEFVLL
jgi:hypothetical protein